MEKRLYSALCGFLVVAVCLALGGCAVLKQPGFGKLPQGDRLERIQGSPNYRDGKFRNPVPTPKFSEDVGPVSVIWSGFFDKNDRLILENPYRLLTPRSGKPAALEAPPLHFLSWWEFCRL